jgi:hypothetical protein
MPTSKPGKSNRPPAAEKKRGSGVRTGLIGVLLAAVAALAIWLSDCVPGFGIGGGEGEGEGQAPAKTDKPDTTPPAKTEAAPLPAKPAPPSIEIGVGGCKLGDGPTQTCAELCKRAEQGEFAGVESVTLHGEQGSQADVTQVIDCLKAAGVTKLAIDKG